MQDQNANPPQFFRLVRFALGVLIVVTAWWTLQAWGLGKTPFHTKGEPREAIVVQQIVQEGEWILPLRNGVEMPRKPPLFHWLAATASVVQGEVDERSVRLPSAVLSGAAALLLFGAVSLLLGIRPALIAALTLLTSFEWLRAATSARVDMTLAFGLTMSFTALMMLRRQPRPVWLLSFYIGLAWATLAKGPVGIVLPLAQIAVLTLLVDRNLHFVRRIHLPRGLLFVLAAVGTWYGLAAWKGGQSFIDVQILDENVFRFVGHSQLSGGHRHGPAYLVISLLAGLLPWTLFLPSLAHSLWSSRRSLDRHHPCVFALLWIATIFVFYLIPASKRGVYLLPLYPAVCLLFGWWFDALLKGWVATRRLVPLVSVFGWSIAGVFGVLLILCIATSFGIDPLPSILEAVGVETQISQSIARLIDGHPAAIAGVSAATVAAAILTALAAQANRWGVVFAGLLLTTAAITIGTRQVILPHVAKEQSRETFVTRIRRWVDPPSGLSTRPGFDHGIVYYWGRPIPVYEGPLGASGPPYLLVSRGEWLEVATAPTGSYEPMTELEPRQDAHAGNNVLLRRLTGTRRAE